MNLKILVLTFLTFPCIANGSTKVIECTLTHDMGSAPHNIRITINDNSDKAEVQPSSSTAKCLADHTCPIYFYSKDVLPSVIRFSRVDPRWGYTTIIDVDRTKLTVGYEEYVISGSLTTAHGKCHVRIEPNKNIL